MVATARDQLIADWRKRLAAAEEADSRFIRACRPGWRGCAFGCIGFLLSLYGEGDWNAPPSRLGRRRTNAPRLGRD